VIKLLEDQIELEFGRPKRLFRKGRRKFAEPIAQRDTLDASCADAAGEAVGDQEFYSDLVHCRVGQVVKLLRQAGVKVAHQIGDEQDLFELARVVRIRLVAQGRIRHPAGKVEIANTRRRDVHRDGVVQVRTPCRRSFGPQQEERGILSRRPTAFRSG